MGNLLFEPCGCGSTVFYMPQRISGICDFWVNADGTAADNSNMYDGLMHKDTRLYYRCVECDRRAKELTYDEVRV